MSPFIKSGARIAGAGVAAAALTLTAAAPASAQTDYEYFNAAFFEYDSLMPLELLEHRNTDANIGVEGPDPLQGDLIEVTMDFSTTPGIVDLAPHYDSRCENMEDVVTCIDDGTHDLSGSLFTFLLSLGEQGAPGDVAEYRLIVTVNDIVEEDRTGQITVSEDYTDDPAGQPDPDDEPDPDPENVGTRRYSYLDHTVTGAAVGTTVTAGPQVLVTEDAGDYRVGSIIVFTDAVDMEKWTDPDTYWDGSALDTDTATVRDEYDNCEKWEVRLYCVVTDWDPQAGQTYAPSADSPIRYDIESESTEDQLGVYTVSDLSEAGLEFYLEEFEIDLGGANLFSMAEADSPASADVFESGEGWIEFSTDATPSGEASGNGQLPVTGNSSIILISSAAAALLAGAVVFFMLRRRKAATSWE